MTETAGSTTEGIGAGRKIDSPSLTAPDLICIELGTTISVDRVGERAGIRRKNMTRGFPRRIRDPAILASREIEQCHLSTAAALLRRCHRQPFAVCGCMRCR